ncbi:hypothetical protein AAL_07568 [Moelleriella libera RCEF 2490]|uniref:Uncharacterized protein n=1 Tax=Moelleriella libera RCEF 2490 TaxID=1081109 RepID=A0A167X612_9HYPO|nr:hypothetical protein AAL_07568 [Moelleriella libera RCEF 2490]
MAHPQPQLSLAAELDAPAPVKGPPVGREVGAPAEPASARTHLKTQQANPWPYHGPGSGVDDDVDDDDCQPSATVYPKARPSPSGAADCCQIPVPVAEAPCQSGDYASYRPCVDASSTAEGKGDGSPPSVDDTTTTTTAAAVAAPNHIHGSSGRLDSETGPADGTGSWEPRTDPRPVKPFSEAHRPVATSSSSPATHVNQLHVYTASTPPRLPGPSQTVPTSAATSCAQRPDHAPLDAQQWPQDLLLQDAAAAAAPSHMSCSPPPPYSLEDRRPPASGHRLPPPLPPRRYPIQQSGGGLGAGPSSPVSYPPPPKTYYNPVPPAYPPRPGSSVAPLFSAASAKNLLDKTSQFLENELRSLVYGSPVPPSRPAYVPGRPQQRGLPPPGWRP